MPFCLSTVQLVQNTYNRCCQLWNFRVVQLYLYLYLYCYNMFTWKSFVGLNKKLKIHVFLFCTKLTTNFGRWVSVLVYWYGCTCTIFWPADYLTSFILFYIWNYLFLWSGWLFLSVHARSCTVYLIMIISIKFISSLTQNKAFKII